VKVLLAHRRGVDLIGPPPPGVRVAVWDGSGPLTDADDVEFWVPPLTTVRPDEHWAAMPRLSVVQLLSAGIDGWAGRVRPGVTLCDARGVSSGAVAEWVMAVLLASVRELPRFAQQQREGRWESARTDELAGRRVLVLGAGDIGEAVSRRLAPFDVDVVRVARRARDNVHSTDELPSLLPQAQVVVVLVPLTDETRQIVDAAFLARLPDGALVVNASRGAVVDSDALLRELRSGRLRAALDVTEPEPLPPGHPLWSAPGLLLTPHVAGRVPSLLARAYTLVGQQLWRHARGEPLRNVVHGSY
jgi:phosphoglycerate dehydrogenase-like enzyme